MTKINDLLVKLDETCVTSSEFVEIKIKIQDELHLMLNSATDPTFEAFLAHAYSSWRKLGVNGTLQQYGNVILDLKLGLTMNPQS